MPGKGKPFSKADPRISPNHGGRPKGLMQYVREQTNDGKELADFALKILRGEAVKAKIGDKEIEVVPEMDDRIRALTWLGERGFGKPIQELDLGGQALLGVVVLPPEDDKT